jgi:DNA-directed RNA polymerase specialized sigma subunit
MTDLELIEAALEDKKHYPALKTRAQPWLDSIAKRYSRGLKPWERQDLTQEIELGFWQGLIRYDTKQAREAFPLAYPLKWAAGAGAHYARVRDNATEAGRKAEISLEPQQLTRQQDAQVVPTPEPEVPAFDGRELTQREQVVLRWRIIEEEDAKTLAQLAAELECSTSRVHQIELALRDRLTVMGMRQPLT